MPQTQSTRGENRPGSQGFGSGPAGGPPNAAATSNFAEGSNNILGGPQAEAGEHETAYGSLYGGQVPSHNGAPGPDY